MDKEIWKDIEGYNGLYQVSNLGRIRTIKIFKTWPSTLGYCRVVLSKQGKSKPFQVHRLVAEAFVPNPEKKPQVNHIDGNKQNNSADNLEWVTQKENTQHAYDNGLAKSGWRNAQSKLTKEDILEIRKNYIPNDKSYGGKALASKYNVNPHTIYKIIKEKSYKL